MKILGVLFMSAILMVGTTEKSLTDEQLMEFVSSVSPADIKNHIAVLADDNMKGRLPGTPEYDLAMKYVVDQYKDMGIQPLGDKEGTTYYQNVVVRKSIVKEENSYMLLNDKDSVSVGKDYFYYGTGTKEDNEFRGEVVMAGYGIEAPHLGYNDYEKLDVKGKLVVVFTGSPEDFVPSERSYFGHAETKMNIADDKGAKGVLFVIPKGERGSFDGSYNSTSTKGNSTVILPSGKPAGRGAYKENLAMAGYINLPFLGKLIGNNPDSIWANYKKGVIEQPKSKKILSGKVSRGFNEIKSANVVGVLEGGSKKDEYIVHSAHLDHVGIGVPVNGDSIYNGAHDNASGISSMIEIARLYSKLETKPQRSVIFLAVTAEEMGLLGSRYYAESPTVPAKSIIANVNTDMPTLIAPLLSIEPLGVAHSSLMDQVNRAALLLDLRVDKDHAPEESFFTRSDQLNFVKVGIPALYVKYGLKSDNEESDLSSVFEEFKSNTYHKPSDELNDKFDFEAAKKYVQLHFIMSYFVNMNEKKPTWNEGDFFARFAK